MLKIGQKQKNQTNPETPKQPQTHRAYFSAFDIAIIAIFAAIQFILQHFTGMITFIPGAERPIVAFPVAFMAALTYLCTRKIGAVGLTTLIAGIIQFSTSGFPPVIFEWVGATIGVEAVIIIAHVVRGKARTRSICLAAGALMLGRGVGVTIGLLIYLPSAALHNFSTQMLLLTYISFNGVIPFVIALVGAYVAITIAVNRGIVSKEVLK